jgi:hypothetical protein
MGPNKMEQKGKNNSFSDLKRLKKEKKKWKEEKLLKIVDGGSVSPNCTDKKNETKIPQLSTFSIAVPASILDNAQSPELRTYLAGQIARAACVFKVDEVRLTRIHLISRSLCVGVLLKRIYVLRFSVIDLHVYEFTILIL